MGFAWKYLLAVKVLRIHSELKQEAIACVCEQWLEFAGYVTGMIGPWYVEEASVHVNIQTGHFWTLVTCLWKT